MEKHVREVKRKQEVVICKYQKLQFFIIKESKGDMGVQEVRKLQIKNLFGLIKLKVK
jgi:hypothetical protein